MSETQIQTQAFSDQAVTDLDTGGVLTFSDVDVSQAVTTDGGLAFAPLPYTVNAQNYGAVSTAATAPYDELQWSGFTSKVEAPSASINLTFTYQVNASNGAYIDGLQQSLQMDANTGPGVTLAAVETVTDDSGNLVWQGTITGAAGETDVVLPYTYSSLNISVSVTEAVSAPIVSGQPIPKIGFSAIEQGFDLTTSANPAPGGPGPGRAAPPRH